VVALAELLVRRGESDEALALLERIPENAETRRVAALARVGEDFVAEGHVGPEVTEKLDALLERVKDDEGARQEFVDLLELLGPSDPRTAQYRKALTSRLF
jgi:putative thioredoxin